MRRLRWIIAAGAVAVGLGVTAASLWMQGHRQAKAPQGVAEPGDRGAPDGSASARARGASPTQPASTLASADLSGAWRLVIPGKAELTIVLESLQDHGYRLSGAGKARTVFDGEYRVQGDRLVMVASPTSYRGFVWRQGSPRGDGAPVFELLTTAYAGAAMVRTGSEE